LLPTPIADSDRIDAFSASLDYPGHRTHLTGASLIAPAWSLALIGNASADDSRGETCTSSRGVFDKETRRKPLVFAADAAAMDFEYCFGTSVLRF
jgi:hypothetical protein